MKTTFGEYIRTLRNENELTLTQLAAKLKLDSANLSKIENGKRDFDEKKLPLLARIFRLNISELRNEYLSDQVAKIICKVDFPEKLLMAAAEKVKYRKELLKNNNNKRD